MVYDILWDIIVKYFRSLPITTMDVNCKLSVSQKKKKQCTAMFHSAESCLYWKFYIEWNVFQGRYVSSQTIDIVIYNTTSSENIINVVVHYCIFSYKILIIFEIPFLAYKFVF